MANYELSLLRNTEPIESKEFAIQILDNFDNHIIGQPISLLYYNKDNELKVLFAVGKKNAYDIQPGQVNYGRDFYDLIGEIDGQVFWKQIQGSNTIVDTKLEFEIISATQQEYDDYILPIGENTISFVGSRIYKGNQLVSSLYLDDMSLYNDIEISGVKYSGKFSDVIQSIIDELSVNWNGTKNRVRFEKTTNLDFFNSSETIDENTIYQVSKQITPNIIQNDLYIGQNRIGDNYNTQFYNDIKKTVSNNVGGIPKGTTLQELLDKGSVSQIIDDILFKEQEVSLIDYWEDIDYILEEHNQNLL